MSSLSVRCALEIKDEGGSGRLLSWRAGQDL